MRTHNYNLHQLSLIITAGSCCKYYMKTLNRSKYIG